MTPRLIRETSDGTRARDAPPPVHAHRQAHIDPHPRPHPTLALTLALSLSLTLANCSRLRGPMLAPRQICIFGTSPPEACIFNLNCEITHSFGEAPRNTVSWSPHGRFFTLAGFGNMSGELSFYDRKTNRCLGTVDAHMTVNYGWSPCSRYFLTAILFPRLRVDNGYRVWSLGGGLLHQERLDELTVATWRPQPAAAFSPPGEGHPHPHHSPPPPPLAPRPSPAPSPLTLTSHLSPSLFISTVCSYPHPHPHPHPLPPPFALTPTLTLTLTLCLHRLLIPPPSPSPVTLTCGLLFAPR